MGFERRAVDHVNRTVEKLGDVILEPDIGVDILNSLGLDVDHDVDVALWCRRPARGRAEYSAAWQTPRARSAFSFSRRVAIIS